MSILIGADFVPTKANREVFVSGEMYKLLGEPLIKELDAADYRIFNLEMPLTDSVMPIAKCGPALSGCVKAVNGYKSINVDLVTLANNHIMDQGNQGLESTMQILRSEGIDFVGAADNLKEASLPFIFNHKGKKIGVYTCVEHEFSIAADNLPGANPFDVLDSFDHVAELKEKTDYVIVLYHGGKEHYRYPSPMLQRVCRKFVKKGADLVVCQHSHCIGCEEKFLNGTIVYGQGNFLFNSCDFPTAQASLLIKLTDSFDIEYIPLEKFGNGVRIAEGNVAAEILKGFAQRSEEIKQDGFVNCKYTEFAKSRLDGYLLAFSGYNNNVLLRLLNKLSGYRLTRYFAKKAFNKKEILAFQNYIECEAHRELLIEGLKNVQN